MKTRLILFIALLTAAAAVAGGCGGGGAQTEAPRSVVAAFYPLAFATGRIAAPGTRVVDLTPPGAEPHDLELSARDAETIHDASVVLYFGSGFQPALERALKDAKGEAVDLLATPRLALRPGDPHVWLDPQRFARIVLRIGKVLDRPAAAGKLAAELRALDRDYMRALSSCRRHELVTTHEAFGYLAKHYGLEQISITGISPEAEPSPQALRRVVEQVRRTGATTIFVEPLLSKRPAETVARETGAHVIALDPLESMPAEGDYFTVMRMNLQRLRKALGCR